MKETIIIIVMREVMMRFSLCRRRVTLNDYLCDHHFRPKLFEKELRWFLVSLQREHV
jgi:hypothetical protein